MTGTTLTAPLAQIETPLLAVALAQGGAVPASLAELDRAAGGVVARAITSGDFKGKVMTPRCSTRAAPSRSASCWWGWERRGT